jgi:thioredoxin reductase
MHRVDDVQRVENHFKILTAAGEYSAQRVLLTIGRRGTPRKLDVPGEKTAKVMYRLLEPEQFTRAKILVVGGGDSAVEAAVALAEQPGNVVHVSYRREGFFRLKDGNQKRIDAALKRGDVTPLFNSQVTRIEPEAVIIDQEGREIALANDFVFVFAGGELPTAFLQKIGIQVTRKFGQR